LSPTNNIRGHREISFQRVVRYGGIRDGSSRGSVIPFLPREARERRVLAASPTRAHDPASHIFQLEEGVDMVALVVQNALGGEKFSCPKIPSYPITDRNAKAIGLRSCKHRPIRRHPSRRKESMIEMIHRERQPQTPSISAPMSRILPSLDQALRRGLPPPLGIARDRQGEVDAGLSI
jgi:hypothetical protein